MDNKLYDVDKKRKGTRGVRKKNSELQRLRKAFENLNYMVMALTLCGQILIKSNYMLGQGCFLGANIVSVYRCFALNRPVADKAKDILFTTVTIALMLIYGGII